MHFVLELNRRKKSNKAKPNKFSKFDWYSYYEGEKQYHLNTCQLFIQCAFKFKSSFVYHIIAAKNCPKITCEFCSCYCKYWFSLSFYSIFIIIFRICLLLFLLNRNFIPMQLSYIEADFLNKHSNWIWTQKSNKKETFNKSIFDSIQHVYINWKITNK